MSWSISIIGTSDKVAEALIKYGEQLTGASKEEYDAALPHLEAIVKLNQNSTYPFAIKVVANGHAYDGHSSCNVSIENSGFLIV